MATAVPSLVVGLLAGVFVDRYDRKRIMIATDLVRAVLVASIPFVIGSRRSSSSACTLIVLVTSGVKQFFDPAEQSVLTGASPATRSWRRPTRSCRSARSARRRSASPAAGLLACDRRPRPGVLHRRRDVRLLRRVHRCSCGSLPDAAAEEDDERRGSSSTTCGPAFATLFGTPILRSTLFVVAPMLFSFGLWNVLLLPFAIKVLGGDRVRVRPPGGPDVGRRSSPAPSSWPGTRAGSRRGTWIVDRHGGMGVAGIFYGTARRTSGSRSCS